MPTFTARASFNVTVPTYPTVVLHSDQPTSFEAGANFATVEEAKAFVAAQPKVLNFKAGQSWTPEGPGGYVRFQVSLGSNGNFGVKNETGMKRLTRFLKDYAIVWGEPQAKNAYTSLEAFQAAL